MRKIVNYPHLTLSAFEVGACKLPVYPVEPAKPAKYNPPAMRVRGVSYTKKITFPV